MQLLKMENINKDIALKIIDIENYLRRCVFGYGAIDTLVNERGGINIYWHIINKMPRFRFSIEQPIFDNFILNFVQWKILPNK